MVRLRHFLADALPRKWEIRRCFVFPPHLSSASALPCETENPEIASFHLNMACCFAKEDTKHLNYHLVVVELPFIPTVIDCMHQTVKTHLQREHSILVSVTSRLYIQQVCHGVGRCVKDGSCSSSSLEWTLMDSSNQISYCLNKCQTLSNITDDIFFFQEGSALVHMHCTGCSALDFLSPEPCPQQSWAERIDFKI